ncbi:hypothetical protein AQ490_09345 [Wenjunlia vitaminophila]|uniref:ABC3 transporter permease protein domain-containing protein n=1 Tax=Wenjunlia vitaminophila TaxID=76728 RepID=A0A0T6LM41_WENVI|nr:ABC transporter permease [Wenjunlia vitaminophila]KRV46959.1 hypothetical protein AQ490_09345 [Wenjunlia vitaminophila]
MFLIYLRRELRRRRRAALLVASGLAVGIALVITVSSVATGMRDAQDEVLKSLYGVGTDLAVKKEGQENDRPEPPAFRFEQKGEGEKTQSKEFVRPTGGLGSMDESAVRTVAGRDGVAAAVGGLDLHVDKLNGKFALDPGEGPSQQGPGGPMIQGRPGSGTSEVEVDGYSLFGVDTSDVTVGPMSSSEITKGKGFTSAQADAKVAVVDSGYARQEKIEVGDTFTISGTKFEVIGIATADTGEAAANVYVPLERAQDLSAVDMKDKVSAVYVKATDADQVDTVKAAIEKELAGTTVTSSSDLADQVSGSLSTVSDLATSIGRWLSVTVLAAAFLVAGLLTSSAVNRRVREFGTLKAIGWRSGRVIRQIAGEAFAHGVLGGLLGIALGIAGALAVTAAAPTLTASMGSNQPAGGGGMLISPPREAASKSVEVALGAPLTATTIALAVALAVAGGLVAGAFGGWRAARLRPADALRRVE